MLLFRRLTPARSHRSMSLFNFTQAGRRDAAVVPPFISDIKAMINPNKHPFYEHSAEFSQQNSKGEIVGRSACWKTNRITATMMSAARTFICLT